MDRIETIRINVGNFKVNETTYPDRCLSASYGGGGVEVDTIPWEGTENNPWDYRYVDGAFVLDPIVIPEPEPEPREDRLKELEDAIVELAALIGG